MDKTPQVLTPPYASTIISVWWLVSSLPQLSSHPQMILKSIPPSYHFICKHSSMHLKRYGLFLKTRPQAIITHTKPKPKLNHILPQAYFTDIVGLVPDHHNKINSNLLAGKGLALNL